MLELDLTNRATLLGSIKQVGVGAENGTAAGDFAATILKENVPSRLFLVDCWECPADDKAHLEQTNRDLENQYHQVIRRFIDDQRVCIIRTSSIVAATFFPDNFFDWIYIDADHQDLRGHRSRVGDAGPKEQPRAGRRKQQPRADERDDQKVKRSLHL